jgi:predicted NACHT family NTPase
MMKELVIKKAIDRGFTLVEKLIKDKKRTIKVVTSQVENSLNAHMEKVINWSKEVGFKDMEGPKNIFDTYIPLDFYFNPVRLDHTRQKRSARKRFSLEQLFASAKNNIVILGQPGAGKSTTMKFLCQKLFTDEFFLADNYNFPLLLRFRELKATDVKSNQDKSIIINYLYNELGLILDNVENADRFDLSGFKRIVLFTFLNELRPLIIFDGLDEISNKEMKDKLLMELEDISLQLTACKFVLTSRSGDYDFYIPNTKPYEISPLSDDQILEFSTQWLQNDLKAKELYKQLKSSPYYDTTIRPLTLAHLCAIFEREGEIPEKPKTVYQKIGNCLLRSGIFRIE